MKRLLLFCISIATAFSATAQVGEDSCADALASSSIVADVTYSVGTINGDVPPLYCVGSGNNVTGGEWIKYVPTQDYLVNVSADLAQNEGKDTRVHVFEGACGSLSCVAGDDDDGVIGNPSYLSVVEFNAIANTTYYIVWDNRWSDSSDFDFILTESDPPPPAPTSPVTFTQSSINAPGSYDLGLVDMNGDFLDDPVSVSANKIYINEQQPDGSFVFREITTSTADFLPGWSMAAGDFDDNGYNDLLYGSGTGVTFMQANADGTAYTEISGTEYVFSQRSNFVDINNDGNLDAFVCHDVAPSVSYINDGSNNLVFNNSNGLGSYSSGGNYASIWIDYDNDGDIDMFMAKCGGSGDRPKNQLHRNNGNGTFSQIADDPGFNLWDNIQTWSSAWGDFDNDGDMDIYIGSSTGSDHTLMKNNLIERQSNPALDHFEDVTAGAGITMTESIGHENIAQDFDNDGNLDVYSNGVILFGNGDLTFNAITTLTLPPGYGGAIGDLNDDGYLDLFASGSIYTNQKETNHNWIKIVTIGKAHEGLANGSNRNGIGARIEINTPSGTQIRDVRAGDGFKYMNSLNTHFGIGADTQINYVKVTWPGGIEDVISNPAINSTLQVPEGDFTLSFEETNVDNLIMHPNPTKGVLNLNSTLGLEGILYSVFDINGRRVMNGALSNNSLDVSELTSGNYILRLKLDSATKTQKFIKY